MDDLQQSAVFLLGQLLGKFDALAALLGTHSNRADAFETQLIELRKEQASVKEEVVSLKSAAASGRHGLATILSIAALLISALGVYLHA